MKSTAKVNPVHLVVAGCTPRQLGDSRGSACVHLSQRHGAAGKERVDKRLKT